MKKYSAEAIRLLSKPLWLALATIDRDGLPTISYLPFAIAGKAFGIVVSRLAAHAAPLLAHRPASVLFVDGDSTLSDAYMRPRLSIGVNANPQTASSASADLIWSALEKRQGETVRTLRSLPDFDAIALEPISGRLVLGFAAAFDLSQTAIAELMENVS
jgi:heme iron utilization protein